MCVYKACIILARLVLRILGKNGIELGKTGSLLGNWCHVGLRDVSWRVQDNTSLCLRISQQRVERGGSVHMHQCMTHHTIGEDVCGGRHRQLLDHLQTRDTR